MKRRVLKTTKGKTLSKVLGAVLLCSGLLMVSGIVKLSTIIYPQYFWYHLYPDSTNSANPTLLSPETTITLDIELVFHDSTSSIELPSPAYWLVSVSIFRLSDGVIIKTINFGSVDKFLSSVQVDSHYCTVAVWQDTWYVPATTGVSYKFTWNVLVRDDAYNNYGTQTKDTFAKTADIEPDGVFKVNGKDTTQTSNLVVLSPELSFEFIASKNAEKITAVKVEVWKGSLLTTVRLTKVTESSYKTTYTLPNYGTYELKGNIEWTGGNPIRKMSIVTVWGEAVLPFQYWNQVFGLILAVSGLMLVIRK